MGTTINPFTGKIGGSSSNLRFNPLAGSFQFSGGSNAIKFDPVSGGFVFAGTQGPVDPLAGISFRMRWETTWDKITLQPMWQDVARTMLVTEEGEVVATMGSDSLEFIPEQGTEAQKAVLFRETDGTPYITLDGVDDCYPIGTSGDQVTLSALFRSVPGAFSGFWGLAEMSGSGNPEDRWGLFAAGTTQWHSDPFPASVRLNGVALASPFNMGTITDWMVVTWVTNDPTESRTRSLFQLQDVIFGNCEAIAMCMYSGTPSMADILTVESFYSSITPS
jgi:hypothetical protein